MARLRLAWIGLWVLSACGEGTGVVGGAELRGASDEELRVCTSRSEGPFTVFALPDGGTHPLRNIGGKAKVRSDGRGTIAKLSVEHAAPHFGLDVHAHVLSCSDNKGGGHYQDRPDGGANPTNELWMHLHTDEDGDAYGRAQVAFQFRPGGARSLVLHESTLLPDGGHATGPKLACVDVDF